MKGKNQMASKKVMIVKGSPRGEGNSAILASQVATGAQSVGANVESFYLHEMNIQPCDACDACRTDGDVDCILDDDMQFLYAKIREADVIVIASPVYWFNVSAQTKIFIDRFYAFGGEKPKYHSLVRKRFGIVMAGEAKDSFESGAVNAFRSFQDTINFIGAELVGMVYGSAYDAGEIRNNSQAMEDAFEMGKKLSS
jgi:multimeric flavodoxin WrbA